jgi:CRP/FNR family transcriptional regulator
VSELSTDQASGIGTVVRRRCRFCDLRSQGPCGAMRDEADLAALEGARDSIRLIRAGETIYPQGEPCARIYAILTGWVALYETLSDGRTFILHFALPGEVLALRDPQGVAPHAAVAVGDVTVCAFRRPELDRLARAKPEFRERQAALVRRDLQGAYENLASLALGSAIERVARLLWKLAFRSLRRAPTPEDRIPAPFSQVQLGLATGLTAVHVSRTLRALREEGLMDLENHAIVIRAPRALERLAGVSAETMALWLQPFDPVLPANGGRVARLPG